MVVGNHTLPSELISTCTDGILTCFGRWAYNVTQGTFWVFALFSFCIALGIATSRLGLNRSYGFASFVGMLGSVFLATMQFMSWWIASIFILNGVIALAVMIMSNK